MDIKYFTIVQGGKVIESFTDREQMIDAAKARAKGLDKPISAIVHLIDGRKKEVIFLPDGTIKKIWNMDEGQPFIPIVGEVYTNSGGGQYRCLDVSPNGTTPPATFQNIKSGWTLTAKGGILQHIDGTIEWGHSTDGRFEEIGPV